MHWLNCIEWVDKIRKFLRSIGGDGTQNSITNSNIDLGGKGGGAPGAGGGGGGVLGSPNSTGGDGGKGGNINLQGTDATAPGAGGGGAGVLGEGAVAAEGGEGGELVSFLLKAAEFDRLEFEVGAGGKSDKNGENTVVKVIKDDKVVRTVLAKGGKAGQPGYHGDLSRLARPLTEMELEAGNGVSTILFSEFCRFKNGLVTLLDAGWETYTISSVPCAVEWPLFLVFSTVELDTPTVIESIIRIKNPEGRTVIEQKALFSKLDNNAFRVFWAHVFAFEIDQCGIWAAEVSSGDLVLTKLQIAVSVS